jgi:hypothetical protein
MARSTFAGPILSGDARFGIIRDVGYTDLVQNCSIVLTNTTVATAGYSGGSGQFVQGNQIPFTPFLHLHILPPQQRLLLTLVRAALVLCTVVL